MTILVTGAAGFIDYHLNKALISRGDNVVGIDSNIVGPMSVLKNTGVTTFADWHNKYYETA